MVTARVASYVCIRPDVSTSVSCWNSVHGNHGNLVIMHSRSNELCEESMQCRTSCGSTEVVLVSW